MKSPTTRAVRLLPTLLLLTARAVAGDASRPLSSPVLDPPTLHCLGVYWIVQGDDNQNARVAVSYRKAGTQAWRRGMGLFRVEKGANKLPKGETLVRVPADAWLFAGSLVTLDPDTPYELRLSLSDPDGGAADRVLMARTLAEPVEPAGARVRHVVPGQGGGSGTPSDPFRGLAAAEKQAQAGDLFLVHRGTYEGTFTVARSGAPGRPIIWRGARDGETIIDAQGKAAEMPARGISASDVHDVWFERLTVRKASWGLVAHASQRIVVRRCRFHDVLRGMTARRNPDGRMGGLFVADNVLEGPLTWTRAKHGAEVDEFRGIELSGAGNVVCYNRVRGFKDGIDMAPSTCCIASDVHNNEVSECLDDGCEMDGSERNNRCFLNRFTNCFQGISVQPVYGGPVYVFRNALYNLEVETFKMHNSPSGVLFLHNTSVKKGAPLMVWTSAKVRHCVSRNNLFIGTEGWAFECASPMVRCDFDYDGFGGASAGLFLKWNQVRYASLDEVKRKAPVYKHAVVVDPATALATGITPPKDMKTQYRFDDVDLRLKAGTAAIDAGEVLPGFNDNFAGKRPDLGAYEFGARLPHYGPRPEQQVRLFRADTAAVDVTPGKPDLLSSPHGDGGAEYTPQGGQHPIRRVL